MVSGLVTVLMVIDGRLCFLYLLWITTLTYSVTGSNDCASSAQVDIIRIRIEPFLYSIRDLFG